MLLLILHNSFPFVSYTSVKLDTGEDEFDFDEEDDLMLDETEMQDEQTEITETGNEDTTVDVIAEMEDVTSDFDSVEE